MLFFQCGSNHNRLIDEESPFYHTKNIWLVSDGKALDETHDQARTIMNIAISSGEDLESSGVIIKNHYADFPKGADLDPDCKVFLFIDGPSPIEANRHFRNNLANYLKESKYLSDCT